MANERRLIDANALSEKIGIMKFEITRNRGGYRYCNEEEKNEWDKLDSFDSLVCDAPTVDAVEVVRCEDCLYRSQYPDESGHYKCGGLLTEDEELLLMVKPDFFCAYGERRGKDAVD